MPIRLDTGREFLPTLVVKPDMRFANTFLDTKYRDYSVPGEALMDKVSGELFMKRPIDGRVISFFQNKKMLHDLTLELRIMMVNNENFVYPEKDDNAFFVSANYDLLTINNEQPIDLLNDYITIPEAGSNIDNINTLNFNISSYANGFFIRFSTRDCDKPIIEFLVNKYNTLFKNYNGDNSEYEDEHILFETNELWEDSSCVIHYTATKYKNNNPIDILYLSCPIRLNESSCVLLPDGFPGDIDPELRDCDYINISITNITFQKIQFIYNHREYFEDRDLINNYYKLIFADGVIKPAEINVMYFVDNVNHIHLLGNEFLLALLDIPYINRYMAKMSKLKEASQFLTTIKEPSVIDWDANTCWAERIRDVYKGGETRRTTSPNSFEDIAKYFTRNSAAISGNIITEAELNEDPDNHDNDFLLIDEG